MKQGHPNEISRDAQRGQGDALWRLLGESSPAEPPPWFAAQTLARCRQEKSNLGVALAFQLKVIWRWALAGGFSVAMAVALMMPHATIKAPPDQHSVQEAFAVVASMDADTESAPSSSWQDQSL